MKFPDLIRALQRVRAGQVHEEAVVDYVNTLDTKIFKELVLTHEHSPAVRKPHYELTDLTAETPLLAEEGYDEIYVWWCCMEIDLRFGDMNRYSTSRSLFSDAWNDFAARYTRTHMPLQVHKDSGNVCHHPVLGVIE